MGFKADTSFLRFLSMGAVGVHRTMDRFRDRGFEPIELERYCGSNKIWTTKVKRLRLPDLLCVKTGMRAEVRAKTDFKIRMSDAPVNPDRVWDAGLRDDDIVALITCFDRDDGPRNLPMTRFASLSARCAPPWTDRSSDRRNPHSGLSASSCCWPCSPRSPWRSVSAVPTGTWRPSSPPRRSSATYTCKSRCGSTPATTSSSPSSARSAARPCASTRCRSGSSRRFSPARTTASSSTPGSTGRG